MMFFHSLFELMFKKQQTKIRLHDPENHAKIKEVWMFISVDKNGNEGVVSAPIGPGGSSMPLVVTEERIMKKLILVAKNMRGLTQKDIKLIKLTAREEIDVW